MSAAGTANSKEDDGAGAELPNPLGLKSEGAKRIYNLILDKCEGRGKVLNKEGDHVGKIAEPSYSGLYPELHFDKPDGSILISRSFPIEGQKPDEIQAACTSELTALGLPAVKQNRDDMIEFHNELVQTLRVRIRSKLSVIVNHHIDQQGIRSTENNSMCKEMSDVVKEFKKNPLKENFPKLYGAYVLPFEDGSVIDGVIYLVLLESKVWYASGHKYQTLNQTAAGEDSDRPRLKMSSLRAIARSVLRGFRHAFTQRKRSQHGCTLTISEPGGRGKDRRKTQQFHWSLVKGWGEQKHRAFCKTYGLPEPTALDALPV